jgi:hypothetical protein
MAKTKVPAIKNIPAQVDRETGLALESMKEALEVQLGRRGDPKDRAVTLRELIDSGLATDLAQSPYNPNTGATGFGPATDEVGDVVVPPAPTSLTASGLFTDVLLSWNQSTNTAPYGNHAFTEIWRSQAEDLSSAVLVGTTNAFIYTDKGLEYDSTYYYWVRFVSTSNNPGPWSNMASATTVENIGATMAALSETLADLPGYNLIATGAAAATVIKQSSAPSTRTDGSALGIHDFWFDTDDGQIYTRNAANNAWVAGRDSTLVNLFGATSFTGSTLTAAMASAQADIITVTNSQSSTATAVTNLTSTVTSNNNTLTASVNTLNTTTANLNGDVNAMFVLTVATESNGSKSAAGMVIGSNASSGSGAQSYVQFQADKFAIWSGSSNIAPFIVDGGVVYIDQARIKDGDITNAKIDTLHGGKIIADTITATQIDSATITATEIAAETITADQIAGNTITATQIAAETITGTEINVDTLAVKKFADVETKIISHRADAAEVPLQVTGENSSWSGTYPGSTIVSLETSSVVNFGVTITNVRNGAGYRVIYSAVLGDVRNGTIQYSFDNSNFTSLSPLINADSGTYRSYVYVWDGNISGLSSTQSTVYWRINWNVSGGQVNSTYAALYVTMDNTQGT